MDKVPAQFAFFDLSDYARVPARWLAEHVPAFVTPIHLTLAFTVVGALAALLFAFNSYLALAAVLLILKSLLDAADGSLARIRRRPSRVGRFLDSVCDFLVTILLFTGIAFAQWRLDPSNNTIWLLAALAALSVTLQCSVFSFYYVTYRAQTGGDQTSQVHETAQAYANDDPRLVAILYTLYRAIYSWQDSLMAWLDSIVAPNAPVTPAFLTATSVLGLGTQLLIMAVAACFNQTSNLLFIFIVPFNFYWLGLLGLRYATRLSAKN
jgi:phosphatidylglycerophosphate synthase